MLTQDYEAATRDPNFVNEHKIGVRVVPEKPQELSEGTIAAYRDGINSLHLTQQPAITHYSESLARKRYGGHV